MIIVDVLVKNIFTSPRSGCYAPELRPLLLTWIGLQCDELPAVVYNHFLETQVVVTDRSYCIIKIFLYDLVIFHLLLYQPIMYSIPTFDFTFRFFASFTMHPGKKHYSDYLHYRKEILLTL